MADILFMSTDRMSPPNLISMLPIILPIYRLFGNNNGDFVSGIHESINQIKSKKMKWIQLNNQIQKKGQTGNAVVLGEWGGKTVTGSSDELYENELASWLVANGDQANFYWDLNPTSCIIFLFQFSNKIK